MKRQVATPAFLMRLRGTQFEGTTAVSTLTGAPYATEEVADKLLSAANDGSANARNIYLTLLGFSLFLALVTGGLTDEKLLLDNAVALPLVEKVDLPLSVFYAVAPWLLVFLHGDLLLNFALLAEKLHRFRQATAEFEKTPCGVIAADRFRHRLANFPFTHWVAGDADYHVVQSIIVWSTIVALPPLVLLSAQIGFLPYHSESIVWLQRLALVADIALIVAFWPSFQGMDRGRGWWQWWWHAVLRLPLDRCWHAPWPWFPKKSKHESGAMRLLALSSSTLFIALFVATFSGEAWEDAITLKMFGEPLDPTAGSRSEETQKRSCPQVYYCGLGRYGWKVAVEFREEEEPVREKVYCDTSGNNSRPDILVHLSGKQPVPCLTALAFHRNGWPGWHRNLDLEEKALDARGPLKPDVVAQLRSEDETKRRVALDGIDPLDLRQRNLRHARLGRTVFPKVDLRGTDLSHIRAESAIWPQARGDEQTNLTGALLATADLQFGRFNRSLLYRASLKGAKLQGAQFVLTELEGADLRRANLQGANLTLANLQISKLGATRLQGADLSGAKLRSADLSGTHLQIADLTFTAFSEARLTAVDLFGAVLENASLNSEQIADLKWQTLPRCIGDPTICGNESSPADTAALSGLYEELLCKTGGSTESIAIAGRMLERMSDQIPEDTMSDLPAPPSEGFNTQADAFARALSARDCDVHARLSTTQRRTLLLWMNSRKIDIRH